MARELPFISKSKYLSGLQCLKLLWHQYNARDLIPPPDAAQQAIFDQGTLVGKFARRLFPDGIEIKAKHYEIPKVIAESQKALPLRRPLFEAGFGYKQAFARVDILNPVDRGRWDIIEVKSSTDVKEVNLHDIALQRYVYEGSGIDIAACRLCYINRTYVRRGEIEPEELFTIVDVTANVERVMPEIEPRLADMFEAIGRKKTPEIAIGPQCHEPYSCPLIDHCWAFLPEQNVLTLSRIGKKGFELLGEGVLGIRDLPESFKPSFSQQIQIEAVRNAHEHVDKGKIGEFLDTLVYPVYFLDFETFQTALPLFDGIRPYEQVPFQFSLHVLKEPGVAPIHHSWLSDGREDPRPLILRSLKELLGTEGSIVAYNAGFEQARLREGGAAFPQFQSWVESLEPRFVDLFAPFRSFSWYHPGQNGRTSMKVVLPALTGAGYTGLAISDGSTASLEFLRVSFGKATENEKTRVRKNLEEYCGLDTSGMIEIIRELKRIYT